MGLGVASGEWEGKKGAVVVDLTTKPGVGVSSTVVKPDDMAQAESSLLGPVIRFGNDGRKTVT